MRVALVELGDLLAQADDLILQPLDALARLGLREDQEAIAAHLREDAGLVILIGAVLAVHGDEQRAAQLADLAVQVFRVLLGAGLQIMVDAGDVVGDGLSEIEVIVGLHILMRLVYGHKKSPLSGAFKGQV